MHFLTVSKWPHMGFALICQSCSQAVGTHFRRKGRWRRPMLRGGWHIAEIWKGQLVNNRITTPRERRLTRKLPQASGCELGHASSLGFTLQHTEQNMLSMSPLDNGNYERASAESGARTFVFMGKIWVFAARPDPTRPGPITLFKGLYLRNRMSDREAVFFDEYHL